MELLPRHQTGLFGIDPDYLDIDFKNGCVVHVAQHTS